MAMFNFNSIQGWLGEKTTQFDLWMQLDGDTYKRFHNLIIQTQNGTTQIDHVLVSRFGIFVIETKNYNGRIYGSNTYRSWTQFLGGTKYSFQNPLRQNYRHTRTLAEQLGIDESKIHSVVVFVGEAELKTDMPSNVLTSGLFTVLTSGPFTTELAEYIQQFNQIVFSNKELARLEDMLTEFQETAVSTKEHVSNLKLKYASTTTCPKCKGKLVDKVAKRGPQKGTRFLGCENYPNCRYTRDEKGG
jgi:restriction system protein